MPKYADLQVFSFDYNFRRSYGDHNFKNAYPLNTGVEEALASQSKRTDLLQSVHANGPAVTTSALPKKSCFKTNLCWCQHRLGGQTLCSELCFISTMFYQHYVLSRTFFQLDPSGFGNYWQSFKKIKYTM